MGTSKTAESGGYQLSVATVTLEIQVPVVFQIFIQRVFIGGCVQTVCQKTFGYFLL